MPELRRENIIIEWESNTTALERDVDNLRDKVVGIQQSARKADSALEKALRQKLAKQLTQEFIKLDDSVERTEESVKDLERAFEVGLEGVSVNDLIFDIKRLNNELEDTENNARRAGESGGVFLGSFLGNLAADALQGVIEGIGMAFGEVLSRASELEAIDVRFGEVFDEASDQVELAARRQARALNLTIDEYRELASSAGDLLVPIGFTSREAANLSTQLVDLSGALSEWTGGQVSAEETSRILTKSLLGEREELKQLGIAIPAQEIKDFIKSGEELQFVQGDLENATEAQKEALVGLELIYRKSTDAQDAFANGVETASRAQARLARNLRQVIDNFARRLTPSVADLSSKVADLVGVFADLTDVPLANTIREEQREFNKLATELTAANTTAERREELIDQIQTKYPGYLGNLDAEKATIEELTEAINKANDAFEDRILLSSFEEQIVDIEKRVGQAGRNLARAQSNLTGVLEDIFTPRVVQDTIREFRAAGLSVDQAIDDLVRRAGREDLGFFQRDALKDAVFQLETFRKVYTGAVQDTATEREILDQQIAEVRERLGGLADGITDDAEDTGDAVEDALKAARGSIAALEKEIKDLEERRSKGSPELIPGLTEKIEERKAQLQELLDQIEEVENRVAAERTRARDREIGLLNPLDPRVTIDTANTEASAAELAEQQAQAYVDGLKKASLVFANQDIADILLNIANQVQDQIDQGAPPLVVPTVETTIGEVRSDRTIDTTLQESPTETPTQKRIRETLEEILKVADDVIEITSALEDAFGGVFDAMASDIQMVISEYDRLIDLQEGRVTTAIELAARGNAEILQMERERLTQLETERERALQKERQIAAAQIAIAQAVALANAAAGLARALATTGSPVGVIAAGIALAGTIASTIIAIRSAFAGVDGFYKGTEYVQGPAGVDQVPARLTKGERVFTVVQNKALGGLSNEEVVERVRLAEQHLAVQVAGQVSPAQMIGSSEFFQPGPSAELQSITDMLGRKLDALKAETEMNTLALNRMKIVFNVTDEGLYGAIERVGRRRSFVQKNRSNR